MKSAELLRSSSMIPLFFTCSLLLQILLHYPAPTEAFSSSSAAMKATPRPAFTGPRPHPRRSLVRAAVDQAETEEADTATATVAAPPYSSRSRYGSPPPTTTTLSKYQARSAPISSSYVPTDYNPHPLLTNRHLQTIGAVFLRSAPNCAYVTDGGWGGLVNVVRGAVSAFTGDGVATKKKLDEGECTYWDERECVDTPDGDFFHVDYKYVSSSSRSGSNTNDDSRSSSSRGTVVLIHGLESNSNSTLCIEIANAYIRQGFDVACMNNRGCSGVPNNKLGGYHLGFTDDLIQFLGVLGDKSAEGELKPVYLSGFSLGANIVLKALGELGEGASQIYNVRGAAVSDAPYDVELNNQCFEAPGFNRLVYSNNFQRTMKAKCQYQLETYCDGDPDTKAFDYRKCIDATTIAEIETNFIAPIYGFEDNIDYYRMTSCGYFLEGIAVPTFILTSIDDPFMDPTYFPIEKTCDGGGVAPIKMVRKEFGGHSGFIFHQPGPDDDEEVQARSSSSEVGGGGGSVEDGTRASSWMPTELARFVEHVHSHELSIDE